MPETSVNNISFPLQRALTTDDDRIVMEALVDGVLELHKDCLRLRGESGDFYTPVWPGDFTLVEREGKFVIKHTDRVIGTVDKSIQMGGGVVNDPNQIDGAIPDNCPGPYWVVGDVKQ